MSSYDYDFLVVGSGFGGSVSALRLVEKGYKTAIIEMGKRWQAHEFPKSNWNVRKYLWMPKLGCYGIQRLSLLNDIFVLSGVGVGGGSLVYANTLLVPPSLVWEDPLWAHLYPWPERMPAHYETAKRMLGVVENPRLFRSDELLRKYSASLGQEHTFSRAQVGVFFGPHGTQEEEGQTFPDPYFGGQGPERTACTHCGGCMVGCRFHAKNSLDQNYLYLAEKQGLAVIPETKVMMIEALPQEGFTLHVKTTTQSLRKIFQNHQRTITARQVVLSAGVLGTVPLLLFSKEQGALPKLSSQLGNYVRSNSEAILGATQYTSREDYSRGIAIGSGFQLNDTTHIEVCRYAKGSDALGLLGAVLTDGGSGLPRPLKWLLNCIRHPIAALRSLWPRGWAQRTLILLVMQTLKNHMKMKLKRPWYWPFAKVLTTENSNKLPTYIPEANQAARALSKSIGGVPQSAIHEVLLNTPTTAHILGGCPMGKTIEDGVIDYAGRVFGYPGLYIIDGSMIGANLGVNPSLTITALAEHAMSHIPKKQP